MGALRGGQVLGPPRRPRLRRLPLGQAATRRQARRPGGGLQARPLLPHAAQHRSRGGLRHGVNTRQTTAGNVHRPNQDLAVVSSCKARASLRLCAGRLLTLSRPRSQPNGGHPIKAVVAGDTLLAEHGVNAERPQAVEDDTSRHRPDLVSTDRLPTTHDHARSEKPLDTPAHTVNGTSGSPTTPARPPSTTGRADPASSASG